MSAPIYWTLFAATVGALFVTYQFLQSNAALYGAVCALLGMLATLFGALATSSSANRDAKRLAAVPQISELMNQAQTQEARVLQLSANINDLESIIHRETHRLHLEGQLKHLEQQLLGLAADYERLEAEVSSNAKPLAVDPEFEKKVMELVGYIRAKRAMKERLVTVQTGNPILDLMIKLVAGALR